MRKDSGPGAPRVRHQSGLSINGNHTLRDGPKRRDLLRVSGDSLLKTTTGPLALRSRLLRSEASRRVLAASRRAPAGENRQSQSVPDRFPNHSRRGRQPNATRLSCSCVAGVCAERHRTSREVDLDVLQLRVLGEYRSTALCRTTCHQRTAVTRWWRSSPPTGGSAWDAPADRVTPLASGVRGRAGWLVGP